MLDVEVAERRLAHRRLDARDLVLRIDGGVHSVLAEHRDGDDVHLLRLHDVSVAALLDLFPSPQGDRIRAGQTGSFEKAWRVQPEVQLVQIREVWRHGHGRAVAVDVPCRTTIDDVSLAGGASASTVPPCQPSPYFHDGRIQSRLPIERLLARACLPIDRARVICQRIDARPVHVDGVLECLANGAAIPGAAVA